MAGKARIINKNEGTKIDFRQDGTKLCFGNDDLILRCDTRQREHPVHIDICADEDGNLTMGVNGPKAYYAAQVDIPGFAYAEQEERMAQPLNMEDVTVTLWSVDGLYLNRN